MCIAEARIGGEIVDTSREIPLKDYSKGERYTEEEIKFLKERWSEDDITEAAKWIDAGTPRIQIPRSVKVVGRKLDEYDVFDLRGINLEKKIGRTRSKNDPNVKLPYVRLEHANLDWAHLEYAVLSRAHLEYAVLSCSHLEHAVLFRANLEHTDLYEANLEHVNLNSARTEDTSFHLARWRPRRSLLKPWTWFYVPIQRSWKPWTWLKSNAPKGKYYEDFDLKGIRRSDPLFDQFVRESEYVRRTKETHPIFFPLWLITCNCGRSLSLWIVWCAAIVAFFGMFVWTPNRVSLKTDGLSLVSIDDGREWAKAVPDDNRKWTYLTPYYFSPVTFSTLGFGDVAPTCPKGEACVMIEVFLGYVALGGLITIFSRRLVPPR